MTRIYKRIFRDVFVLVLLSGIAAGFVYVYHPKVIPLSEAKPDEWAIHLQMISKQSDPLWVDARSVEAYKKEHVSGAVSLNLDENWDEAFKDFLLEWSAGRLVVVYCSSESCQSSRELVRILRESLDSHRVFYLRGGWEKLKEAQQ